MSRAYVLRRHTEHSSRSAVGLAHQRLSAYSLTPAPPLLGDPALTPADLSLLG